jgi:hypothetical protein
MKEVDAAKYTSGDGKYRMTCSLKLYLGAATSMWEDISLAHLDESELCVVGVCRKVFKTVTSGAEETKNLIEIDLIVVASILAPKFDTVAEEHSNVLCR